MRALHGFFAVSLLLAACSPVVTSSGDYTRAASRAAGDAASEVATSAFVCELATGHRATWNYLAVVSGNAEQDVSSIASTFDELQPPTSDDITTRDDVDALLSEAQAESAAVRIAVTAGRLPPPDASSRLLDLQQRLDDEAGRLAASAP